MGSVGDRNTGLACVMVAALFCGLLTSCGGDNGIVEPEPPASLADLLGSVFFKADGTSVGIEAVQGKPLVGIYFSAGGCPACGAFTPQLVSVYEQLHQADKSFEVVLVTFEANAEAMFAYMAESGMPWLALPFGGDKATAVTNRYNVRWIPTLIVVDGQGRTVSMNGREEIAVAGSGAYDAWLAWSAGQ